jgi:hypothetical protein
VKAIARCLTLALLLVAGAFAQTSTGVVLPQTAGGSLTQVNGTAACVLGVPTANLICYRPFTLSVAQSFVSALVNITSGSSANPSYVFAAIYSADLGTLLTHVQFNAHLTGSQTAGWSGAPILQPGNYVFAFGSTTTTGTFKGAWSDVDVVCSWNWSPQCGSAQSVTVSGGQVLWPASLIPSGAGSGSLEVGVSPIVNF